MPCPAGLNPTQVPGHGGGSWVTPPPVLARLWGWDQPALSQSRACTSPQPQLLIKLLPQGFPTSITRLRSSGQGLFCGWHPSRAVITIRVSCEAWGIHAPSCRAVGCPGEGGQKGEDTRLLVTPPWPWFPRKVPGERGWQLQERPHLRVSQCFCCCRRLKSDAQQHPPAPGDGKGPQPGELSLKFKDLSLKRSLEFEGRAAPSWTAAPHGCGCRGPGLRWVFVGTPGPRGAAGAAARLRACLVTAQCRSNAKLGSQNNRAAPGRAAARVQSQGARRGRRGRARWVRGAASTHGAARLQGHPTPESWVCHSHPATLPQKNRFWKFYLLIYLFFGEVGAQVLGMGCRGGWPCPQALQNPW